MITVDTQSQEWQAAMHPTCPRVGSMFRADDGDGPGWSDFRRLLEKSGLAYEWVRWMPRAKVNVYRITKGK
jgi:hypothetical protein